MFAYAVMNIHAINWIYFSKCSHNMTCFFVHAGIYLSNVYELCWMLFESSFSNLPALLWTRVFKLFKIKRTLGSFTGLNQGNTFMFQHWCVIYLKRNVTESSFPAKICGSLSEFNSFEDRLHAWLFLFKDRVPNRQFIWQQINMALPCFVTLSVLAVRDFVSSYWQY
jgi:hypothetical protein